MMSSEATERPVQIWVDVATRRKLKMLAAREELTMQELVETTTDVYESLERLAQEQGTDVPTLLKELVKSFRFREDDDKKD